MRFCPRASCRRLLLTGLLSTVATTAEGPNSRTSADDPCPVFTEDGSIHLSVRGVPASQHSGADPSVLRIGLNLPTTNATPYQSDEPRVPTTGVQFDHNGIRYTRLNFLTPPELRIAPPDTNHSGTNQVGVLMIQLVGENTSSEYTDAAVSLSLEIDNQPLELELSAELLRGRWKDDWIVLGAINVPAEGIERSTDSHLLKFRGHMPPGTSGSMTIKIPMLCMDDRPNLDWLIDLEFDEELRRLKRAVRARR